MKIALIGCGNMGSAIARHLVKHHELVLSNRGEEKGLKLAKELGARFVHSPQQAIEEADWVILAIKPKDLKHTSSQIRLKEGQVLVSVLGGVSIESLKDLFNRAIIVRMMPNTAITTGKGIVGFSVEETFSKENKQQIDQMFSDIGLLVWLPESKMDGFAALAASSPAFGFLMIEAMMEAGIRLGFSAHESKDIVCKVFEGCVSLLKAFPEKHPAELKLQITSPAGTTIEGIYALESQGVRAAIFQALEATAHKK